MFTWCLSQTLAANFGSPFFHFSTPPSFKLKSFSVLKRPWSTTRSSSARFLKGDRQRQMGAWNAQQKKLTAMRWEQSSGKPWKTNLQQILQLALGNVHPLNHGRTKALQLSLPNVFLGTQIMPLWMKHLKDRAPKNHGLTMRTVIQVSVADSLFWWDTLLQNYCSLWY